MAGEEGPSRPATEEENKGETSPLPSALLEHSEPSSESNTMLLAAKKADIEKGLDWVLTHFDEKKTEPQSLDEELRRLQALRSYLVLDSEREFPFERLTALASRILDVPIALVSLIDLGRQWFMSNRGLGDVRETPRSQAFCAHAILSKDDLLIVNDATKDPRFENNPLVTGPPHIRFYAGSPLLAPEGYKLGTFCIIDTKPRPEGLDLDSKQNLQELSALAVQVLVTRRRKQERDCDKNSQLIACIAHDLLTPLSGIELSLSLLREDEDFQGKLKDKHKDGLTKASICSSVLQELCKNVRSTFSELKSSFELSFIQAQLETVRMDELVERLYTVIDSIPKKVPVEITVDEDVPREIISDAAKIFRCAMNYLAVACARTETGWIALRFFVQKGNKDAKPLLFVKCHDTAPAIDLDMYQYLFKPITKDQNLLRRLPTNHDNDDLSDDRVINPELALFSVACQMNVVGGEFGFRPHGTEDNLGDSAIKITSGGEIGSVFWFCIPFSKPAKQPASMEISIDNNLESPEIISHVDASKFHQEIASMMGGSKEIAVTKNPIIKRQKRALIIEDSTVVRKMLTRSLTKLGFEVSEAENGLEGLVELKNSLFDLALCDFLMPAMDGLDCVQQYRDWESIHRPWLSQRIVGISAHASPADVEKGLKVGMNDYRPKPVTLKVLSEITQCGDQVAMSKRLDDIESSENHSSGNEGSDDHSEDSRERKRMKTLSDDSSNSIAGRNGRQYTCFILVPQSTRHTELIQDTMRRSGWQSTIGHNDSEAWTFLRMRTWDLILVDETFASLIADFRMWELKHRTQRRERVVLMSEGVNQISSDLSSVVQPPHGIDEVVGKPVCLKFLEKRLQNAVRTTSTAKR